MSPSAEETARVDGAVRAARATGHTQWLARVVEVDGFDVLGCYARCEADDRFVWERRETGEAFVAWGRVDEIESAGSDRFADVEAWASEITARLHGPESARPVGAPLLLGGFGFEPEGASASEWKAFPSARFLLPAAIAETGEGGARLTLLARIEPGMVAEHKGLGGQRLAEDAGGIVDVAEGPHNRIEGRWHIGGHRSAVAF